MRERMNPYDLGSVAKMMRNQRLKTTARIVELRAELKRLGPASPYDLSSRQMHILHEISALVFRSNRH